jgi:hypothetical protein
LSTVDAAAKCAEHSLDHARNHPTFRSKHFTCQVSKPRHVGLQIVLTRDEARRQLEKFGPNAMPAAIAQRAVET